MLDFCFAKAYPTLPITADFKQQCADFIVHEQLGFTPSGQGEHVYLYVEKQGINTELVAKDIAKQLALPEREIAFSGLKDKQAIARQWFSMPWPIKKPFPEITGNSWHVLETHRHDRKLRRGTHQQNFFSITLKNVQGDSELLAARLALIKQQGFANYFGEQRFGHQGQNVQKALALFRAEMRCKPFQRSLYYSAARSYVFNCYLSKRVEQGTWNQAIAQDYFNLAGSNSVFFADVISEDIANRVAQQDIHPAGLLLGDKSSEQLLWQQTEQQQSDLCEGIKAARIETAYRPLRCLAEQLTWQLDAQQCVLQFYLRSGSFATALIRELVTLNDE